jgi:tetratricopeptide (TPR) repeat protein
MPNTSRRARIARSGHGLCGILCCWLLVASGSGCRALRSADTADASLAGARRLSLQAFDAQQRGEWEQAEALFATAIAQCPADERARHGYAESLWHRGDQEQAVAHMEEAVRLSGKHPERLVQLGGMYLNRGELQRAGSQADQAIAANPQLASAWALRGQVHEALGQQEPALASFHRALAQRESYPEVQLATAAIYARQNRPQRALATLQTLADAYSPDEVPAEVLIQEAFACRALGRYPDAAAKLVQAAERGNASAELYYELAQSQVQAGDAAEAWQSVQAALARDPAHTPSRALALELTPRAGNIAAAGAPRSTAIP